MNVKHLQFFPSLINECGIGLSKLCMFGLIPIRIHYIGIKAMVLPTYWEG